MKKISALLLALIASSSFASTTTTATLNVSTSVSGICVIQDANLVFSTYNPGAASAASASSDIHVICTKGTAYTLGTETNLSMGGAAGGNTDRLNFNLSSGAVALSTGALINNVGTGSDVAHTFSGSIPLGQWVKPDNYSKAVVMTVTY